jgi:hypothetical protein
MKCDAYGESVWVNRKDFMLAKRYFHTGTPICQVRLFLPLQALFSICLDMQILIYCHEGECERCIPPPPPP